MHYTSYFKTLREETDLTMDGLARKAGLHRNTIINIETGRSVKFQTIAKVLDVMGIKAGTVKYRIMAVLWASDVCKVDLSAANKDKALTKEMGRISSDEAKALSELGEAISNSDLSAPQIKALARVAKKQETLSAIMQIMA